MPRARLFYVVGASGVGKDSLLGYARARLQHGEPVIFAHRYITRPAGAGGENHVALTDEEFKLRKRAGLFVMEWESHALRYGIGTEINYWLAMGLSVVVNGSRGYLLNALKTYPDMRVIWISATPEVVAGRLAGRGRESGAEITLRIGRRTPAPAEAGCSVLHIGNDGPLEIAGEALLGVLVRDRD